MTGEERIVAAARGWIGTPYRHQASLRGVGCDCLGLVRGVWREVHGAEPEIAPPYSPDWAQEAQEAAALAAAASGAPKPLRAPEPLLDACARHLRQAAGQELFPGMVLAFRWRAHLPAKHLAILSDAGRMIHAHDGAAVTEVALTPWWRRRLAAAYRFPEIRP